MQGLKQAQKVNWVSFLRLYLVFIKIIIEQWKSRDSEPKLTEFLLAVRRWVNCLGEKDINWVNNWVSFRVFARLDAHNSEENLHFFR